ncbi:MAG: class I SAM-dependent methyltransferase [Planctomycetota bacterium]
MNEADKLRKLYEKPGSDSGYLEERFGRLPWTIAHEREIASVAELVNETRPQRILDLASGPGRIAKNVPVPFGVAIDASKLMIKSAAMTVQEKWRFVRADAFSLPFAAGAFDLVCCFRFLRHYPESDREKVLSEIRRVLAAGGRIIFDVLNAQMSAFSKRYAALDENRIHDEKFTPGALKAEMSRCGFEIESMKPVMRHLRAYHIANLAARNRFMKKVRRKLVGIGEKLPSKFPFGWVAVAKKS